MSHTPGPWKVEFSTYGDELWFGGEGCGLYQIEGPEECYLAGRCQQDDAETAKANAYLIAAAPDLLEALEMARQELLIGNTRLQRPMMPYIIGNIDKAIKKAKGEKQ